jgi:hypothetical protein
VVSDVELHLTAMRQLIEWGKQSHQHGLISMAFRAEALLAVVDAALAEHAAHFEQYKDDKEGCATCFYLNELVK